jgi:DNA polymerase III sliding clamp (beta) subunit (PCNA family)
MKFKAKNKSLKKALEPVIGVATQGVLKDIPEGERITLEAKPDELLASAFGGKLGCSVAISDMKDQQSLDYECKDPGAVTVKAKDFIDALDSFKPDENLTLEIEGQVLVVRMTSKSDELQHVGIFKDPVSVPPIAKKSQKELTIKRPVLIEGIKWVLWGCSYEEHKEVLWNWRLTATKNKIRFAAGTGGLFTVMDVHGKFAVDGNVEFLVHKDQTIPILNMLESSEDEDVCLRQSEAEGDVPAQIVFKLSSRSLIFVGIDLTTQYPKVDDVIERKRTLSLRVKMSEWEYPTKGILATYTEEVRRSHDSHDYNMLFDLTKKYIQVTSATGHKSQRSLPIEEVIKKGEKADGLVYLCQSMHLKQVVDHVPENADVTMEFFDEAKKPIHFVLPEEENESWAAPQKLKVQRQIIFGTMNS